MIYLIIYLVGVIFSYYFIRIDMRKCYEDTYSYKQVGLALLLSTLGPYFGGFIFVSEDTLPKPPKWL